MAGGGGGDVDVPQADSLAAAAGLFVSQQASSLCPQLDFRTPPGFDRTRNAEIGNKDIKFQHLEEAFTSEHWLVRIYKVKKLDNREVLDHKPRNVGNKQKYTSKKVKVCLFLGGGRERRAEHTQPWWRRSHRCCLLASDSGGLSSVSFSLSAAAASSAVVFCPPVET